MARAQEKHTSVPLRGCPSPPGHLPPVGRKKFRDIARQLNEAGLLSLLDRDLLANYCSVYVQLREALEHLGVESAVITNSNSCVQKNPWWNVAIESKREMRACMAQMGLTPAARSKLKFDEEEEANPFAELDD